MKSIRRDGGTTKAPLVAVRSRPIELVSRRFAPRPFDGRVGRITLNSSSGCRYAAAVSPARFRLPAAEVLCVLPELWDSKSGYGSDLQQMRVLHEERRSEVQGNDVDDESGRARAC